MLFNVEETFIQKDFLQISELVYTENYFTNRSMPLSFNISELLDDNVVDCNCLDDNGDDTPKYRGVVDGNFYTEYQGSSALLSENIFASKWSVYPIFIKFYDDWKYADDRKYYDDSFSQSLNHGFLNKTFVWILGANFNDTSKIDARKGLKCSEYSCYEKSLENGKICTPGRLTNM